MSDSANRWPDGLGDVEIFWTLISLLALEPDQQLRCLGPVPGRDAPGSVIDSHSGNPIGAMASAFDDWYSVGIDILDPCTEALDRLNARFDALFAAEARARGGGAPTLFCREELQAGRDWQEIRELARETMRAAGETARRVPEPIPFRDIIEFQT